MALIVNDPGDVEEDRKAGEQHAERDEDCDGSAASCDVHEAKEVPSGKV